MVIPVPQPEIFSITPTLNAWAMGTQMRQVEEDRATAAEQRMQDAIARGAFAADTPEEWTRFLGALQQRFPDADLSSFQDFSSREMALGNLPIGEQIGIQQYNQGQADRATAAQQRAVLGQTLQGLVTPGSGPSPGTPSAAGGDPNWMRAGAGADQAPQVYRDAIASIESDGSGGYQAVGPVTDGDRPYGRYQVMGANIGPWTEQVLGRRMTPQEFLASPEAQDQVFDAIFGGYVRQYGPSGAAQAWFGGPGSVGGSGAGTDVLGTSGNEYVQRFNAALGQGPAVNMPPAQRQLVMGLIEAGDLNGALGIITAAMQPPEPTTYGFTEVNGTLVRTDERGGTAVPMLTVPEAPGEQYGPVITGADAAAQNLDPTKSWQRRLDTGEWQQVGGGGVNVNLPGQATFGTVPAGYARVEDANSPTGFRLVPEPGGEAEAEIRRFEDGVAQETVTSIARSTIVLDDIDRAIAMVEQSPLLAGWSGQRLLDLGVTGAVDLRSLLTTINSTIGIDRLLELKAASPTGASGFGALTAPELQLLLAQLGSLDQAQSGAQLIRNLRRVRTLYGDVLEGLNEEARRLGLDPTTIPAMGGDAPAPPAIRSGNAAQTPNLAAPAATTTPPPAPVQQQPGTRPVTPAASNFQTLLNREAERAGVVPVEGQTVTVDGRPYVFHENQWWQAQ